MSKEIIMFIDPNRVHTETLKKISMPNHNIWYVFSRLDGDPMRLFDMDRLGITDTELAKLKEVLLTELTQKEKQDGK